MRVIDLYLTPEEAEQIRSTAAESGHRVVCKNHDDGLEHVRLVVTSGSPDELLEGVREKVESSDSDNDFYVVFEPVAIAPQDEDEQEEEPRAAIDEIERFIADGARLTRSYIVLSCVSGVLATAGLLRDSPAVLVGAMVLAPLFKPMASAGAGIVLGRVRESLFGLALLGASLLVAALAGCLVTLVTPGAGITPAVELRTGINAFDLVIALASGVAMGYTLIRRDPMGMVGIVVAASLVPVSSAMGVSLAMERFDLVGGAAVTMLSNVAGILVALTAVCKIEQVRRGGFAERRRNQRFANRGLWIGGVLLAALVVLNVWDEFWREAATGSPRSPRAAFVESARELTGVVSAALLDDGSVVLFVEAELGDDHLAELRRRSGRELGLTSDDAWRRAVRIVPTLQPSATDQPSAKMSSPSSG